MLLVGLIVASLVYFTKCANILGIFAMPSYSHFTIGQRLLSELADRGHNVTMISSYKLNTDIKNIKHIYLDGLQELINENKKAFFAMENQLAIGQIILCYKMGVIYTNYTLASDGVQNLIKSNQTFDVVIIDQFLNEAFLGIAHHYNAPVIYSSSLGANIWSNHLVGNPAPLAYIPNIFSSYVSEMNFYQRMDNFLTYILEEMYRRIFIFPQQQDLVQSYFPGAPHLNQLMYSSNPFILVNSHPSINDPIPHVPNMVELAGYHIKPTKLPKKLQKFMDEAKEGVIYFSLGSNLKSADLPEDKRKALLQAFGKLKEKVVWKFEIDLPDKPDNLKIGDWFPQQAILEHTNTKAFISHGGLLSTIESIYFGVPIIGIPIYADQKMNIKRAVSKKTAIHIPFTEISEEKITWALNEILHNKIYRDNIKIRSKLLNDRPVKPIDEAVYWVEYIVRYKGASHLRNAGMNLNWFQYEMLDVILFLLIILIIVCVILHYIVLAILPRKKLNTKKVN